MSFVSLSGCQVQLIASHNSEESNLITGYKFAGILDYSSEQPTQGLKFLS